jgi:pimeloyl-ACP methyl ester carboxylesterase
MGKGTKIMTKDYSIKLSDGEKLDITAYGTDNVTTRPCVIFVHGFKGFKDWGFVPYIGEYFANNGFFALTFNFSHNGIASGTADFNELDKFERNTFSREIRELGELIDVYKDGFFGKPGKPKVGVIGHSRGGAISLLTAWRKSEGGAVATWSSVSHIDRYSDKQKEMWRRKGCFEVVNQRTGQVMKLGLNLLDDVEKNKNDSLSVEKAVKALNQHLLIVHGQEDESVPVAEAREIYDWADSNLSELFLVPGKGHTFGIVHPFAGSNPDFENVLQRSAELFEANLT